MKIIVDDLDGPEIKALHSPPDCVHALVTHIIATAQERGYERLSLETGSGAAFEPAHSLYLKFGFEFYGPFADYSPDQVARFMIHFLDSGRIGLGS